MVEIQCPHCDEEIELDDDSSGVFACPYCDGEFEWNLEPAPSKSRGEGAGNKGPEVSFNDDDTSLRTYALIAVVLGSLAAFTTICAATIPIFGLCNLLLVTPGVVISFINKNKLQQYPDSSHKGMINAGFWLAVGAGCITILAQIVWLVMILIAPESTGEWFLCGSGEEIPIEWVNDGFDDCWDGSDES